MFPRFAPFKTTIWSLNVVNDFSKFWRLKDFTIFSLLDLVTFSYSFWQLYNLLDSCTNNLFIFLKSKSFSHYLHIIKTCYSWKKKIKSEPPIYSLCLCFLRWCQSTLKLIYFSIAVFRIKLRSAFHSFLAKLKVFFTFYFLLSFFYYLNSYVVYLNINKWVFCTQSVC